MSWYLNYSYFDAGKYIAVNIPASTSDSGRPLQIEWEIEFEAKKNGTEFIIATGPAFNTATTLLFIRSGTDFELRSTGNTNWIVTTGVTLSNFNVFKIRSTFNGTTRTQTLSINGVVVATRTPATAAIGSIGAFFGLNSNSSRHGDFKYLKFTDFVTPANNRFYDANASGGTGTLLPETIGGFTGTQVGTWPTGDTEWVPYSSGTTYTGGGAFTTASPVLTGGGNARRRGGAVMTSTLTMVGGGDVIGGNVSFTGGAAVTFSASMTGGGTVIRRGGASLTFGGINVTGDGSVLRRGGAAVLASFSAAGSGIVRRIGSGSSFVLSSLLGGGLTVRIGGGSSSVLSSLLGDGLTVRFGGGQSVATVIIVGGGEVYGQGYKPTIKAPVLVISNTLTSASIVLPAPFTAPVLPLITELSAPTVAVGKTQRVPYTLSVQKTFRGQTCIL